MKAEIVENRGQQVFLLAWMVIIFGATLFFRDPVIYLQAFDVFGEIFFLGSASREKGKIDPSKLPELRTGLLAARDRLDIPGLVQDIFAYDRSVARSKPLVRQVMSETPNLRKRVETSSRAAVPKVNAAEERRRKAIENMDGAYGHLTLVGTIDRNGKNCVMVKFKGVSGVMAERIITMEPGDEVWPETGVFLKETGLLPASRVIFAILSTKDGDTEITKVYNTGE